MISSVKIGLKTARIMRDLWQEGKKLNFEKLKKMKDMAEVLGI